MIQIVKPDRAPKILRNANSRGPKESKRLRTAFDEGEREFEFKSSIYAAKSVKNALIKAQHKKCCFCESKITHASYGDVEHFRPKGGTRQQAGDDLAKPGYYWLAYDWSNLFLSCTLCNQRHKRNLFPLVDPSKRATSHHDDVFQESPLFVDPSADDPQEHIAFREEIAYAIDGSDRGVSSIDSLGLNRPDLEERRRERLGFVRRIKRVIELLIGMREQSGHLDAGQEEVLSDSQQFLNELDSPEAEYSSMIQGLLN